MGTYIYLERDASRCPRRRYGLRSAAPAGARDRDRSRRPARPGRAAATVLVVGLVLLGAAAAEAQTERILVSNTVVADDDNANTSGNDHAQLFHTGGHTDGYSFTGVLVNSEDTEGDDFDVEICEEDGSADEFPSSTCTALTAPSSFTAGFVSFTGNLLLSANTNYVVVIKQRGTGSVRLKSTTNTGEDSIGLSDWSIKNKFYWKSGSTWMIKSGSNEALRIVVRGYERGWPTVTGVALTSDPGADATYGIDDAVNATVTFSAAVDITGTPQLELNFDGTPKPANCTAATNTTTMVCRYTVAVGDTAPNGSAIAANKLTLNGGTITATGSTTVNAVLAHAAVAIDARQKVDGIRPTLVTTGNEAPTTSTDGTQVILTFSETIIEADRTKITIGIGGGNVAQTSAARTVGTTVELDLSTIIDATVMLTVALSEIAVRDGASNGNLAVPATPVINAIGSTTAPTVAGVAFTSDPGADNTYAIGDSVLATVTFSFATNDSVDITGTPQLELDFDGTPKPAACMADTGTEATTCSYTVVMGDSAPNGIAIAANTLTLNGGTITATSSTTTNADLAHAAVAIDTGHKVDGIRPTLVTTGSEAPTTSTDGTTVILTFSEDIEFVNRSLISILANGATQSTTADSRAGNKVELTLATALTATATNLTVALATNSVFDAAGNSISLVLATGVTNAVGAPDPPGTLKARRGDGEVHLEWVPVAAVPTDPDRAYQLRYGVEGGESNQWRDLPGSAPGGPNARSYTVTGLENGTRYAFDLRVRRDSGVGTAAKIRQTPEAARWSVSTNRRSVHEGEDVTLSIATRNAVGFYSAPEALTLAVMGQIVLEFATIDGADPEDFEIRVDGTKVQGYTKDITVLNFDKDLARDPFPAQHFDVEVPVGSTSLDVTVTVLADEEEDGQEHMSFMVFRGEELVNEDTWDGTGVNIESRDAGVVKQLAVADAEATEGEDPSLDFVVTLAPAAAWTVTVDYATRDGTARAGSDYTDTSGALTFAPGETAKTVSVPVIDDTVEDTPETLTVRLSNATPRYTGDDDPPGNAEWGSQEAGVLIADAVATGTIRNTEDEPTTPPDTLTASFPESRFASRLHKGSDDRPQVVVAFSEAVTSFARDTPSVEVTGGTIRSFQAHTEDGLSNAWIFFLSPEGNSDVTFTLTAGAACDNGGICTAGGTTLTDLPAELTIPGPDADDGSNDGGATVTEEPGPLTASFSDVPAVHDGTPFTFTLTFSEAPDVSYVVLRDDAFAVSGGDVDTARRKAPPSNLEWTVTVEPSGDGDVTVELATTSDCAAADAICTADDTPLTVVPAAFTVAGPAAEETEAPPPPPPPLTASFEGVPAAHDGSSPFTFRVRFNLEPRVSYTVLRDESFAVTGGKVNKARRVDGRNDLREIHIEPEGWEDVTVRLAGGRACGTAGAICTEDDTVLANTAVATVRGPLALSVADARVNENAGEPLAFAVTLSRGAAAPVTVAYATADGTATAGQDYTATSGTLTFAPGETAKTVPVPVLDDAHDDTEETLTLTLSNATGARIRDGAATGTIVNADSLQQAWLARFGRTVATHVTDAVGERLRGAPGQDSHLTVGGYRLPLGQRAAAADTPTAEPDEPATDARGSALLQGVARLLGLGPGATPAGRGGTGTAPWLDAPAADPRLGRSQTVQPLRLREVLVGSSFRLTLGAADDAPARPPRLTAWGRVAATRFDGRDGTLTLDGDVLTGTVGVDGEWDRLLAGVAVAHSQGDGSYTGAGDSRGDLEQTLTSLHPYLRYAVTDRLDVWGLLGYGWGELELAMETGETRETDTNLMMGAFGGRGILLPAAETGGFELATRTDAMLTRTTSEAVAGLAAGDAEAHRLRLILEGSRGFAWEAGRSFTPTVEVGLRHDWGDAETGFGVEVGGRVQYADPALGLTIEGAVRGLLAHEDRDYEEWGASGTVRVAPGVGGRGLSLTLSPTWGAAQSGVDGLWSRQTTTGLAPQSTRQAPTGRLNAEIGYGVAAPFGTGLLTPYAGTVLAEGAARTYRLGTRWITVSGLTLNLEGTRQEPVGQQPVNQGLRLQVTRGF